MVECTGLENQRTAMYRGFESLSLRKATESSTERLGFFLCHFIKMYWDKSHTYKRIYFLEFLIQDDNLYTLSFIGDITHI